MEQTKYLAACISPNLPWDCRNKKDVRRHVDQWIRRIEGSIAFYDGHIPIKLFVFPELSLNAPDMPYFSKGTLKEEGAAIGITIPGEETELLAEVCRKHDIYIVAGSAVETDSKYPDIVFNGTAILGPEGLLARYRKVNTWLPFCVYASPADLLPDYDEELWPVAKTPIGNIGVGNCYDWVFPEVTRSLTLNGAEILVRVSAYFEPWGATPPMDWWTVVNRCRALENVAYVVACNTGVTGDVFDYPGIIWPGQSQIIDWEGRLLAQAAPGDGERLTIAPIDIDMLRYCRKNQLMANMPAHLRTAAYSCYKREIYPAKGTEQYLGKVDEVCCRIKATIAESRKKLWNLE